MKPSSSQRAKGLPPQLVTHDASQLGQHGIAGHLAEQLLDLGPVVDAELQQAEAAALAGQPLIEQQLKVAAALQPGEGIGTVPLSHQQCL